MSFERFRPAGFAPAFLAIFATALTGLTACEPAKSGNTTNPPASATAQSYTVRGIVLGHGTDGREWQIHHEAIPSFVGIDGKVQPMDAMVMPFPLDAAFTHDLKVGDKITFTFQVDWQGSPPLRVTQLEKLPAETQMGFEAKANADSLPQPGGESAADPAAKPVDGAPAKPPVKE